MDSSNPFERKILPQVTLPPFQVTLSGKKPKSKKRKLSSDLLKKKLNLKAERAFHKDMKEAFPIGELSYPGDRSERRRRTHSRKVDIRKAQEDFKSAKKAARKTRKTSKK